MSNSYFESKSDRKRSAPARPPEFNPGRVKKRSESTKSVQEKIFQPRRSFPDKKLSRTETLSSHNSEKRLNSKQDVFEVVCKVMGLQAVDGEDFEIIPGLSLILSLLG